MERTGEQKERKDPKLLDHLAHGFIETALFTLLVFPALYALFYRPVKRRILRILYQVEPLHSDMARHTRTQQQPQRPWRRNQFLLFRLLAAQEDERRRISRKMHDELGAALAILKIRLNSIRRNLDGQAELKGECDRDLQYLDQIIENVRQISTDLSPSILQDFGLTAAIRSLADSLSEDHCIRVENHFMDIDSLFSRGVQITIYRILQEAVVNIVKHSEARNVTVEITRDDGMISFIVEDNGKGFNVKKALERSSSGGVGGISAMFERAHVLGGSLRLWSQEGKGTRVSIEIPSARKGDPRGN